ncbi:hypothetical protein F4810DRAFT_710996 [Camillea tinctor]|nr:hypothetical protein F4810DRAFT_710996 [Camillea tinctor]
MSRPQPQNSNTRTFEIVKGVIKYFQATEEKDAQLNDTDLARFHFKRTHIDYTTGTLDDEGSEVFQQQDLQCFFREIYILIENTDFHIGRMVGQAVRGLFNSIPRKDHPDKTALEYTPWNISPYPQRGFGSFRTIFALYSRHQEDNLDVTCFNAVDHGLQESVVYLSELYTACAWVGSRLFEVADHSREVTVTVVSVSGKTCRITQVRNDGKVPMELRQSDIFTLEGTEEDLRRNAIFLVCWLLGKV